MNLIIDPDAPLKFDRRREARATTEMKVTMTVLDGPGAGTTCELRTRDSSFTGVSFSTELPLSLGQNCQLLLEGGDRTFCRFVAMVIRSHMNSEGRYEVAMRFRRQIAA
jgi:hypothetical protein